MFKISKPTKAQVIRSVEMVIVAFVFSFGSVWTSQPDPFSKSAVLAAIAAAGVAVYNVVKSIITTE